MKKGVRGMDPRGVSRLIGLTDGLFATVLTILVLDLKLAPASASSGGLASASAELWPHLFSYVITFVVAGLFWLSHHRDFQYIVDSDRRLLWLNLMFLLFVGLCPFTTASVSAAFPDPVSWDLYAGNMIMAGLMLFITWRYAVTHGLVDPLLSRADARALGLRHLMTPALFLVSAGIQYIPPISYRGLWVLLAVPVLQVLMDRIGFGNPSLRAGPRRGPREWLWQAAGMLPLLLFLALIFWMSQGGVRR